MNRRITIMITCLLLLSLLTIQPGSCKELARATARMSVTILGGDFNLSASNIQFGLIDLRNGKNTAVAENVLNVVDPTGTGDGWNLTMRAEDLVSPSTNKRLSLQDVNFTMEALSQDRISGNVSSNTHPRGVGHAVRISTTEQKIVTAEKNTGMGSFQIRPRYLLSVPTDAPTGEYSSCVTYSAFQGP